MQGAGQTIFHAVARAGAAAALVALCACGGSGDALPEHVTFTQHVAPIVFEHCSSCHRPGEAAPFSLVTYRHYERRAQQVSEVVHSGFMPPWLPEPGEFPLVGEVRMTEEHKDLLRRWVKQGAPEGDPALLPPLPSWPEGWRLGEPDHVVEMVETYTLAAEGRDVLRAFVIPAAIDGPRWVRAVEIRPETRRLVHHAVFEIDRTPGSRQLDLADAEPGFAGLEPSSAEPPDGHLVTWTVGRAPLAGPRGSAWRLDPGTDFVLRLRMQPTGRPEPIRVAIGLHFTEEEPAVQSSLLRLAAESIDLPPGARDQVVEATLVLAEHVQVLGLYPDARYLCRTIEITAALPDGRQATLLRIDDWDFHWQEEYRYLRPVPLPAGTTVRMRYTYDNSARNERNPSNPPVRVVAGSRPVDEAAALLLQVISSPP